MITFVIIAALMLLAALAWVLVPLLKRRPPPSIGREESNLAILRDGRKELEADLANGTISADQYEISRAELDRRVLEETQAIEGQAVTPARSGAWTAALVAAVLPIAAVVLYLALGAPAALSPDAARMAAAPEDEQHATSPQQIEAMVEQVKQKLAQDPNNAEGWIVLARTYYVTGRAPEAAQAYEKAVALLPADADILADYADALGVAQGRSLDGQPAELVERALKANPTHWKANALAGTIAYNRKDYAKAVVALGDHQGRRSAGLADRAVDRGQHRGGPAARRHAGGPRGDGPSRSGSSRAGPRRSSAGTGDRSAALRARRGRRTRRRPDLARPGARCQRLARRHAHRLRPARRRLAHAARTHDPQGEGPAARLLARRLDGHVADDEALRPRRSHRRRARLALRQPDAGFR